MLTTSDGNRNITYMTAANITSNIGGNDQIAISEPGHHDRRRQRVVLLHRSLEHDGNDESDRAVEQPELAFAQADDLQLVAGPGRSGAGR